jgi:D-alanine-D-alanine ligase
VSDALQALGHEVVFLGDAHELLAAPERLSSVELVFNLAEGAHGRCREAWVPTLLELHGVPYVGSDPLALALGLDKAVCKRLARAAGVPTPRWISAFTPQALPDPLPLAYPVIVKPRWEGSGRGIDAGAVVQTASALAQRAQWLYARCAEPLLIEEFIDGGELTVCLIGNDPPQALPVIQRPVDRATRLSCHVVPEPSAAWDTPLILDAALEAQAVGVAQTMFQVLGCRDMARVDLRVDRQGQVWFLEINPLPSFDLVGSFGLLAEATGTTYAALIGRILDAAMTRVCSHERV